MPEVTDGLTPMIAQYQTIKKDYPDALLFYRMGDFYELFFDDAVTASRELQIALTTRGKGAHSCPMCGVPWHASQSYLAQLVDKGYNVAICEQVEDPKTAKGLVRREVTCIITPGTVLDDANLGAKSHNYLGAIFNSIQGSCGFAWADVSTGRWSGIEFGRSADMWQWVRKLGPRELLLQDGQSFPAQFDSTGIRAVFQPAINFELRRATERILTAQGVADLASLGLDGKPCLVRACGAILAYLDTTGYRQTDRLMPFRPMDIGRRLIMDELTERNLEIFCRLNGAKGKGTLRHVMDETITPMGGRFLEDMLHHPWRDPVPIRRIQQCVAFFHANDAIRARLRAALESVLDLERLIMRICLGRAAIRDYLALRQSLLALPKVLQALQTEDSQLPQVLEKLLASMDDLSDCAQFLQSALVDDSDFQQENTCIFRQGFNAELDRQLDLLEHGEQKLQKLLQKEQEAAGIPRMRLGSNRVFGYYFEIPRSSLDKGTPAHFIRRQTLANAERFSSAELKSLEEDILLAEERRKQLEAAMMENLRAHMAAQKERILQTGDVIAQLDYWQGLAEAGRRNNWCMPELTEECELHIYAGRHPVVENIIGRTNFVANDLHMDAGKRFCLLTGPNMAGKSTVLRQAALICLMAQMGSMVPAGKAVIGIVDRIFSRVGASDNLAQGQSTFMVEMMETARILRQAGRRSLVILDEIGRGTSTYDGMAIAWAVVEDLAARRQGQVRTIFATHYHELTALEGKIDGLFTMNIAVCAHEGNDLVFLHRLLPGPADRSYGIEVARLAGVPYPVVQRARDILKNLEKRGNSAALKNIGLPGIASGGDNSGAELLEELKKVGSDSLTAEKALELLKNWLKKWGM